MWVPTTLSQSDFQRTWNLFWWMFFLLLVLLFITAMSLSLFYLKQQQQLNNKSNDIQKFHLKFLSPPYPFKREREKHWSSMNRRLMVMKYEQGEYLDHFLLFECQLTVRKGFYRFSFALVSTVFYFFFV